MKHFVEPVLEKISFQDDIVCASSSFNDGTLTKCLVVCGNVLTDGYCILHYPDSILCDSFDWAHCNLSFHCQSVD